MLKSPHQTYIAESERSSILSYSILFYSILFYSILFYSILVILFNSILFILFNSILFHSSLAQTSSFYALTFHPFRSVCSVVLLCSVPDQAGSVQYPTPKKKQLQKHFLSISPVVDVYRRIFGSTQNVERIAQKMKRLYAPLHTNISIFDTFT